MEKIDDLNKVIETLEDAERALKIARDLNDPPKMVHRSTLTFRVCGSPEAGPEMPKLG